MRIIGFIFVGLIGLFVVMVLFRIGVIRWFDAKHTRSPQFESDPDYGRDAIAIEYAVRSDLERFNRRYWQKHRKESPPANVVGEVGVAEIFYHPSRLRIAALVSSGEIEMQSPGKPQDSTRTYSSKAILGFRDDVTEPYLFWDLSIATSYGSRTLERAFVGIRVQYLEHLKGKSMSIGQEYDALTSAKLSFNMDDPEFWDSVIWEIGARHPTLYPFQVRFGIYNRDPDPWLPTAPLVKDYPEWILEMYRSSSIDSS